MKETLADELKSAEVDDGKLKIWETGKINGVKIDYGILVKG